MKWYKIYLNGENRIWKKCITYSWEFIYEDKEINFQRIIDSSSSERYQIHIPEHTRSLSGSLLGYKTIP